MLGTERRPDSFSLLVSVIDRPAMALAEIAARPRWRWVLPVVLLVGAMVASAVLTSPLTSELAQRVTEQQLATLPAEQAELARAQVARLQQPSVMLAMSIGTGLLGLILSWLLASAILYFSVLIAGGDVNFNALFATLPWVWLPFALRDVVQTAYVLYRNALIVNPGLSYFVSTGKPVQDAQNLLYTVLGHMDLFTLWHLGLVFALLWVLPRFSRGKAFLLTLLYAALSLGLRLLPTLLGRAFMPA
ncbi:MAG: YIP1 family protein [Anaerolineae bacterium]|nr:YIP1 family protein [Anaerolineae bacterium]